MREKPRPITKGNIKTIRAIRAMRLMFVSCVYSTEGRWLPNLFCGTHPLIHVLLGSSLDAIRLALALVHDGGGSVLVWCDCTWIGIFQSQPIGLGLSPLSGSPRVLYHLFGTTKGRFGWHKVVGITTVVGTTTVLRGVGSSRHSSL